MKRYEEMVEQVKKWQDAGIEDGEKEYAINKNGIEKIELQAGSGTMVLILTIFMESGTMEEVVYGVGRKAVFRKNQYANSLEDAVEQVMMEELPVKPKIYIRIWDESSVIVYSVPDDDSKCSEIFVADDTTAEKYAEHFKATIEQSGLIECEIVR